MGLCQCRDACWCCKCVGNSNLNVTVILDLNWPSTTLRPMLRQRSGNVVRMLWQYRSQRWGPTLRQCSGNIMWTLCECQCQHWEPMLPLCSHNVAWMLSQRRCPTLSATLPQHSPDIAWTLSQHWPTLVNVVTTLWQHWDFGQNTTLVHCSHNIAGTFKSIHKWTSPQSWYQRWDNVARMLEH